AVDDVIVNFLPLGFDGGPGSFLEENDERTAQRHAGREQTGKQAREILEVLRRNFIRAKAGGQFSKITGRRRRSRGGTGLAIRAGFFREADGSQAEHFYLAERVGPAGSVELAFRDGPVGLQCSVLESRHSKKSSKLQAPNPKIVLHTR